MVQLHAPWRIVHLMARVKINGVNASQHLQARLGYVNYFDVSSLDHAM
jgi:hypothetical protein